MIATSPPQEFVLRNDFGELRRMSAWLDAACTSQGIDDDLRFKLDLCANEALTNIISYAFVDASEHYIRMRLRGDAERIELEFEDDGAAFDPFSVGPRNTATSLKDAPIGGWGLLLIRQILPESIYERRGDRNILRVSARRNAG